VVRIGSYQVETDILYRDEFVWVRRVSDSEAMVGITDYGQATLKDITTIQVPAEGQRFGSGSEMMLIESISRDYSFKSPVSCLILEVNRDVAAAPDILNEDAFANWIVRVEVLDLGDLDVLIDGDDMADRILEEVGSTGEDNPPLDDDFDYESEFSIDSSESYYEDEDDDYW
jgi:glycine cleavage system H protein